MGFGDRGERTYADSAAQSSATPYLEITVIVSTSE
jgi:hypothetical protein